jgi:hypothetical protein
VNGVQLSSVKATDLGGGDLTVEASGTALVDGRRTREHRPRRGARAAARRRSRSRTPTRPRRSRAAPARPGARLPAEPDADSVTRRRAGEETTCDSNARPAFVARTAVASARRRVAGSATPICRSARPNLVGGLRVRDDARTTTAGRSRSPVSTCSTPTRSSASTTPARSPLLRAGTTSRRCRRRSTS